MNLRKKTISVGEAVRLAFGDFEREYVPSEILHENRVIHSILGADEEDELEIEMEGWRIRGRPDKVLDDRVVEVKVQRPLTKADDLLKTAVYQAALYAYALNLRDVEVWIYVYSTQEVKQYHYTLDDIGFGEFLMVLEKNLQLFEQLRKFRPPNLKQEEPNKLVMKAVKEL